MLRRSGTVILPLHDPEVLRAVSMYQLGLPRMPASGRSGELLGRGTGASLEFQEYREYMPGDDIRHLDWSAYARSDALMVRLYREEISPRMDVLLDVSRSMSTSIAKMQMARQLSAMFAMMAGKTGSQPSIWLVGDEVPAPSVRLETLSMLDSVPFQALGTMDELLADHAVPFKRQAIRVVISDFLFPHEPGQLVRRLAGEASVLWLVQVLTSWESDPIAAGGTRLVDIESGNETDVFLNRQTIAEYKQRLLGLQQEIALHCRRHHAVSVTLVADQGLTVACREELSRVEILRAS
jgi:uncharacterized protein (DUF58 family)